jgi:hypothetical protein
MQFFWFPKFKLNRKLDDFVITDADYAQVIEKATKDLMAIGDGGDGAKFISMYHFASRIDPENVPPVDLMYRFYHKDETFKRHFELEDNKGESNFSGDMMSGVVLARAIDMSYGIDTKAKEFARIIKNISLTGLPFTCSHPHNEPIDRGYIWPLWGDGADVLKCVAMLDLAIASGKQAGEPQYQLMIVKYLILITNFPLWIWSYDSAVMTEKTYLAKWFGPHSRFLYMTSGYITTGAWYYKLAMKRLFKKYGDIIPDIAYLYKYMFPKEQIDVSRANYLVDDYVKNGKGTQVYNGPKATMIHLENWLLYLFKKEQYKVERATMVPEAKYRFETYIWEREPFKVKTGNQSSKTANCIDLVLTAALSRKINQK